MYYNEIFAKVHLGQSSLFSKGEVATFKCLIHNIVLLSFHLFDFFLFLHKKFYNINVISISIE